MEETIQPNCFGAVVYNDKHPDGILIPKETIAELFTTYGGSFVRSLGEALRHADPFNTLDLLLTFNRYVKYYLTDFYDVEKGQIKQVEEKVVASAVKVGKTVVAGKRHGDAIFLAHQLYGIKKGVSFEQ